VLFHHEPEHDDGDIDAMLETARAYAKSVAPGLTIIAAAEGTTLPL
jgi:hypothetical protein